MLFQESQALDYLHTVSAIVDSIERKVELTTFERFTPPKNASIPTVMTWEKQIEKVYQRLELLRDDTECAHLALLAGFF